MSVFRGVTLLPGSGRETIIAVRKTKRKEFNPDCDTDVLCVRNCTFTVNGEMKRIRIKDNSTGNTYYIENDYSNE